MCFLNAKKPREHYYRLPQRCTHMWDMPRYPRRRLKVWVGFGLEEEALVPVDVDWPKV